MKISKIWWRYLIFLIVVFSVGLLTPALLTDFFAQKILEQKLDDLKKEVDARSYAIGHAMLDEVNKIKFDCGEGDIKVLRDLNLYNSQFRVQGLILKDGRGCSSLGAHLDIPTSVISNSYSYRFHGYDVGVASTISPKNTKGEPIVFINVNGNVIYWVLNSAWLYERLQKPCENCFYLEYFKFKPYEAPLFFPRGNEKIKLHSLSNITSASVEGDAFGGSHIVYRMLGGDELAAYTNKKLWAYSLLFMGGMFFTVTLVFFISLYNKSSLTELLYYGVQKKEFLPYYQPIVNARTGQVIGAEALLRWYHKGEMVLPGSFIDHAEQYGLILDITEQILEKIIVDLDKLPTSMWISVNVVPEQIENGSLFNMLQKHRWHYNSQLCFEITERMRVRDFSVAREEISKVKTLGYRFKLDDFGTGYGGFSYIQKLGIDEIKIDKMFVDTIGTNDVKKSVLDAIIAFAKEADMDPVAEGVETQEQIDYLLSKGIDNIQGFIYAKPLPIDGFIRWIAEYQARQDS